jgi:4-hydroxy-3-polyprenylbenzoate decarboxylase
MAFETLQQFLNCLESQGELKKVSEPVSVNFEIAEITRRVNSTCGSALFFENIIGHTLPVCSNIFGSTKRMKLALGIDDITSFADLSASFFDDYSQDSFFEKYSDLEPIVCDFDTGLYDSFYGDDVDLGMLSVLKSWEEEGGHYITLPSVFTIDPDTKARNCGMYRMQVFNKNTCGMHWDSSSEGAAHFIKYKSKGIRKMPVVVSVGSSPSVMFASAAPVPQGLDEMYFAGFINGEAIKLMRCKDGASIAPYDSEIILEGYVDTENLKDEGAFGNHTGYYEGKKPYPVFCITCLHIKKGAVYPSTVVGKPPVENNFLAEVSVSILAASLTNKYNGLADMYMPLEGIFGNIMFLAIDKDIIKDPLSFAKEIRGNRFYSIVKVIVLFDKDVDIRNLSEVMWKLGNNVDWVEDVDLAVGKVHRLSPRCGDDCLAGKVIVDATGKEDKYTSLKKMNVSEHIINLVNEKWEKYGL